MTNANEKTLVETLQSDAGFITGQAARIAELGDRRIADLRAKLDEAKSLLRETLPCFGEASVWARRIRKFLADATAAQPASAACKHPEYLRTGSADTAGHITSKCTACGETLTDVTVPPPVMPLLGPPRDAQSAPAGLRTHCTCGGGLCERCCLAAKRAQPAPSEPAFNCPPLAQKMTAPFVPAPVASESATPDTGEVTMAALRKLGFYTNASGTLVAVIEMSRVLSAGEADIRANVDRVAKLLRERIEELTRQLEDARGEYVGSRLDDYQRRLTTEQEHAAALASERDGARNEATHAWEAHATVSKERDELRAKVAELETENAKLRDSVTESTRERNSMYIERADAIGELSLIKERVEETIRAAAEGARIGVRKELEAERSLREQCEDELARLCSQSCPEPNDTASRLDSKVYGILYRSKDHTRIPSDEFIVFRPADNAIEPTLECYRQHCIELDAKPEQIKAVEELQRRVRDWRERHPERLKVADVADGERFVDKAKTAEPPKAEPLQERSAEATGIAAHNRGEKGARKLAGPYLDDWWRSEPDKERFSGLRNFAAEIINTIERLQRDVAGKLTVTEEMREAARRELADRCGVRGSGGMVCAKERGHEGVHVHRSGNYVFSYADPALPGAEGARAVDGGGK